MWYDTHDVTQHLRDSPGPRHAVGLTLAPGWDSRHGTGKEGIEVKLRLSIDLEGGTVPSIIERRPALFFSGHISPIFAPLFLVFSRFSPS